MFRNYLGKRLFPQLHPSQYAREFKIIAVTLSLGLIIAGGLTTVMILRATVGK